MCSKANAVVETSGESGSKIHSLVGESLAPDEPVWSLLPLELLATIGVGSLATVDALELGRGVTGSRLWYPDPRLPWGSL